MSKLRVFLDTNVIFSALYNPNGLPAKLIYNSADLELMTSSYVMSELSKIISKRYPSLKLELTKLCRITFLDAPDFSDDDLDLKSKDIPVLRAAQYFSCDYLVTGDLRDFKRFMSPNRSVLTRVVRVSDLIKIIKKPIST